MATSDRHELESHGVMDKDTQAGCRVQKNPPYENSNDGEEYRDSMREHIGADSADMLRMGKVQELKRNYRSLSAFAFTVILQGTWEVAMT